MRLVKIKLAGFKSFVDPTTVPISSNLVCVVGPNGCGKSNIIDAVRWVMGESSAKHLRGENMTDVIFNGSNTRKPVGQASIELVFDNTLKAAGGQYAAYNEISVRRVVTRDSQSFYYLNGTKCRRRDITDLFLGTGLGPRSYAIIEQGMISRVIESKPEELRVYVEEAAGISKYKERRRETETRMRHTRENLERLTDLREEVTKQLDKLQRQAKVAEKYKTLKSEERQTRAELLVLKLQQLDSQMESITGELTERETKLEATIAQQREAEKDVEVSRQKHIEMTDSLNEIQGRFYAVGGEIAKIEQEMQHRRSLRSRQQAELEQAERSWQEANEHIAGDQGQLEEIQTKLLEIDPELTQVREQDQALQEHVDSAHNAWQGWQQEWDEFNQAAQQPQQVAQAERARLDAIERNATHLMQRSQRLQQEKGNLSTDALRQEIQTLSSETAQFHEREQILLEQIDSVVQQSAQTRDQNRLLNQELEAAKNALTQKRGRLSSLEALQQAALGKANGNASAEWLQQNGLADARRVAEVISVQEGWEQPVELVLGKFLEATCVDVLDQFATQAMEFPQADFTLVQTGSAAGAAKAQSLAEKVSAPQAVLDLLANVRVANSFTEALALLSSLEAQQSVVTSDGLWLSRNWLRCARSANEEQGVLAREAEIKRLTSEIELLQAQIDEQTERLESGRQQLQQLEQQKDSAQAEANQVHREAATHEARLSGKRMRLEQIEERLQRLLEEEQEIEAQRLRNEEDSKGARERLHEALALMEQHAIKREELSRKREQLKANLDQVQLESRQSKNRRHELELVVKELESRRNAVQQALDRLSQQLGALSTRREELQIALAQMGEPEADLKPQLEELLQTRLTVENELTIARQTVGEVEAAIREGDQKRLHAEQSVQVMRSEMESGRMRTQEIKVRRQTLLEQLEESEQDPTTVAEHMAEHSSHATIEAWEENLASTLEQIQRLGTINLAAIDEYEEQSERKIYLDKQNEDLNQALTTLEDAIKKIDRETRTRFKETFDQINKGLQEMFPKLFGGGHAYLELTGTDLLDTGVSIMARPPGKKISNIHLMSGGEKALTAVALVFSIFELNPAPFCMLDEVDAPLDEANVGRFGKMVKEMSSRVQFVYITHNKGAMEIAQHMMGVTMHEPGVSRLVSVDIDEAVEMAAG